MSSTVRTGLGSPRSQACETSLACCQGPGQPGLTSFCKAWQAGSCRWTQGWTCSGGRGSPRPGCRGPGPLGKARNGCLLFPWLCLREPTSPRQACGPRAPPPQLQALSYTPLFAAWSVKIPTRPRESSQSHSLRLQALERNGSIFPLHGEQAGSRIKREGQGASSFTECGGVGPGNARGWAAGLPCQGVRP